jgi:acetoin utilization deacetylase AcuC-like enzyme
LPSAYRIGAIALYLAHPSSYRHDTGPHPENARRLESIEKRLAASDWLGAERAEAPAATIAQLERVHSAEHVRAIEAFAEAGGGPIDLDTVTSSGSYEAALHAAGGAASAAERLLAGDDRIGFCGLRPPGHHAERSRPMGFCLFNNAAVAAAHAIQECGAERVMVIDWDVHHGNGTEAIFAASDQVLYSSIHQWPLYPGSGAAEYAGEGAGEGYTVNLPVPPGAGGPEFTALVEHVLVPIGRQFEPRLIIISAGYDAHRDDPLASCTVETDDYGAMAAHVRELGRELDAPVMVCLEGGYDPAALAASVEATIRALEGKQQPPRVDAGPAAEHVERLRGRWSGLGGLP